MGKQESILLRSESERWGSYSIIRGEHDSQWAAITSIAGKVGFSPKPLRR